MTRRTGRCICGAVRFSVAATDLKARACHCADCRRWAGGPLYVIGPFEDVAYEDESPIGRVTVSEWAERGFCVVCGSHLFIRVKESGRLIVSAGLFEPNDDFRFDHQIFIDQKPAHYSFAEDTPKLTAAEVWARHAASDE